MKNNNNSDNNKHEETEMITSRKTAFEVIYHKFWKTAILLC